MRKFLIISATAVILSIQLFAQKQDFIKRTYTASKIEGAPPVIDGLANDSVWNKVPWEDNFIQRDPYENTKPS